jgi:ABC-type multidrug transport system ATPase subunit
MHAAPQSPALLTVTDLGFAYPGRWVFAGWSHAFAPGLTWLRGDNGCGKSTLLKLLAGALTPAAGRLVAAGADAEPSPLDYRRQVFWCGPDPIAFGHLRPPEWYAFLAGLYPAFDHAALPGQLQALGLEGHLHKRIDQLSTGTGRKVAVAAALVVGAPVVLIDEPLVGLDRASIRHVQAALAQAARAAKPPASPRAWIVTSHEPLGEAEALAQRLDLAPAGMG